MAHWSGRFHADIVGKGFDRRSGKLTVTLAFDDDAREVAMEMLQANNVSKKFLIIARTLSNRSTVGAEGEAETRARIEAMMAEREAAAAAEDGEGDDGDG